MEPTRLDQIFSQAQAAIASQGMRTTNTGTDAFSDLMRQRLRVDEKNATALPAVKRAEPPKSAGPVLDAAPAPQRRELASAAKPARSEKTFVGKPDIRAAEHAAPNARVHEMTAVCHGNSSGKCADESDEVDVQEIPVDDAAPIDGSAAEPEADGAPETDAADSDATESDDAGKSGDSEDVVLDQTGDDSKTSTPIAGLIEATPQGQTLPQAEIGEENIGTQTPLLAENLNMPASVADASASEPVASGQVAEAIAPTTTNPLDMPKIPATLAKIDAVQTDSLAQDFAPLLTPDISSSGSLITASSVDKSPIADQSTQPASKIMLPNAPVPDVAADAGATAVATTIPLDGGVAASAAAGPVLAKIADQADKPRTQTPSLANKENAAHQANEAKLASTQLPANAGAQNNSGMGLGYGQGQGKASNPSAGQTQPTPLINPVGFETGMPSQAGQPGWSVHLAQGLIVNGPARRAEFVANLRQHLQNLPLHDQVALSIRRSIRDGSGQINLQLSPAELGRVHVKLDIDDDNRVQATVTVERPTTLDMLQRDIRALERALQEAGLKTDPDSLSFNLKGGQADGFGREMGSTGNGSGGNARSGDTASELQDGDAKPILKPALIATADGLVDVEI